MMTKTILLCVMGIVFIYGIMPFVIIRGLMRIYFYIFEKHRKKITNTIIVAITLLSLATITPLLIWIYKHNINIWITMATIIVYYGILTKQFLNYTAKRRQI